MKAGEQISRWLLILALTTFVVIIGAWANRDLYTKSEVDSKIETVQDIHDRDMAVMQDTIRRIDDNVKTMLDHMLEEKGN